jgi:hypothetical protein
MPKVLIPPANVIERILDAYEGVSPQVTEADSALAARERDKTKYLFNGSMYGKGRLVLAVVRKYVTDNPDTSFDQLQSIFPKSIQGSFGVFNLYDHVQGKYSGKQHKRHFVKPEEIIQLTDAQVVVCTEWGVVNIGNFLDIVNELGYDVKSLTNDIQKDKDNFQNAESKINDETFRVHRKIPRWFRNLEHINSRILVAYLKLQQKRTTVTLNLLKAECEDINTFTINYNAMKRISANNHAKVFQEDEGVITLWQPVSKFILSEFNKHQMRSVPSGDSA